MNNQIDRIKNIFLPYGEEIYRMALFGSYLSDPDIANDIDVIVWMNPEDYESMKKTINHNNVFVEPFQCSYSITPEVEIREEDRSDDELPVHICSLPIDDKEYIGNPLWERNKKVLKYI